MMFREIILALFIEYYSVPKLALLKFHPAHRFNHAINVEVNLSDTTNIQTFSDGADEIVDVDAEIASEYRVHSLVDRLMKDRMPAEDIDQLRRAPASTVVGLAVADVDDGYSVVSVDHLKPV